MRLATGAPWLWLWLCGRCGGCICVRPSETRAPPLGPLPPIAGLPLPALLLFGLPILVGMRSTSSSSSSGTSTGACEGAGGRETLLRTGCGNPFGAVAAGADPAASSTITLPPLAGAGLRDQPTAAAGDGGGDCACGGPALSAEETDGTGTGAAGMGGGTADAVSGTGGGVSEAAGCSAAVREESARCMGFRPVDRDRDRDSASPAMLIGQIVSCEQT